MATFEKKTPASSATATKPPIKRDKPPTKVIIRRLPPDIDKETFQDSVSPIPDYNYIYLVKGDYSLGENAFSRVYLNFVCPEDVYNFKDRFDNYVFLDKRGNEFPAVVEFAAFQKIPKKRGKSRSDPKAATLELDPIYQEFVESVNNKPEVEQEEKPEYCLQLNNENKNDRTTPLLEFIKTKRAQRLHTREIRREERKKRELDRKTKTYEDKPKIPEKAKPTEVKEERKLFDKSYTFKNKDKPQRFEPKRKEMKPKFNQRKEDRVKYEEFKAAPVQEKQEEVKAAPKKVKKYSEKRLEAQKRLEELKLAKSNAEVKPEVVEKTEKVCAEVKEKEVERESAGQRRIRNKDRPTVAIYRPGMLSKRKQTEEEK